MNRRDSARGRARIRGRLSVRGAAALAAVIALAGCATQSTGTQSVTISGSDLAIYISAPTGYAAVPQEADTIDAEELAFKQLGGTIKGYQVTLHPVTSTKLSYSARRAISNTDAVAYIGELSPGASEQTVGITNAQDLLQVSPGDTALELTQTTPAVPNSYRTFYQSLGSYGRTFARVVPSSAVEAIAQVKEMKALGVTKLDVATDGTPYGSAIALAVTNAAKSAGLTLTTGESGADGFFYGSASPTAAVKAVALAGSKFPNLKVFLPSGLDTDAFAKELGGAAAGVYVSSPGFLKTSSLPAAGQAFITAFTKAYGHAPAPQAIFGYEAMRSVIAAIVRAGQAATDRRIVDHDYFATQNPAESVIGPYAIEASGDTTFDTFVFSKLQAGTFTPVAQVQG